MFSSFRGDAFRFGGPKTTQFTAMLTSGCDFYLLTLGLRAVLPRTAK